MTRTFITNNENRLNEIRSYLESISDVEVEEYITDAAHGVCVSWDSFSAKGKAASYYVKKAESMFANYIDVDLM